MFFFIFLFATFSCGFAQEKSLAISDDSIFLAADANKFPSAEENNVPKPEDGDNNCANLEGILRDLSAEREKNRDLNQTLSDILERMADMERDIIRNGEKITINQASMVLLTKDVEELNEEVSGVQDDVITVAEDVNNLKASDEQQETRIEDNIKILDSLKTRGTWCGYQNGWDTVGTITYDRLTFSDTNINNGTPTPLDILTGNECYYAYPSHSYFCTKTLKTDTFQGSLLCHYLEYGE